MRLSLSLAVLGIREGELYESKIYNFISDMRSQTKRLQREREEIEKEKQELLKQQREMEESITQSLPVPVPVTRKEEAYMDNVMDSVLDAVKKPDKVIPGAKSFEDIEAYLDEKKKEKKDQMRQRNKNLVKPKGWWLLTMRNKWKLWVIIPFSLLKFKYL